MNGVNLETRYTNGYSFDVTSPIIFDTYFRRGFPKTPLQIYKDDILVVARDLQYRSSTIARIKNATSEEQIDSIMHSARIEQS